MLLKKIGFILLIGLAACNAPKNGNNTSTSGFEFTNALINERSPYLLQHAHNPVNWYPWGEEALKKAEAEDKLMIISIGYAACHWCHVMEHESFEDSTVAKIMNDNFVCIKVDREERPDVDDVYMTACQLSSQRGCGWPLNAFALPDGRPVWAGTYFPKNEWLKVLEHFKKEKESNSPKLEEYATQLTNGIEQQEQITLNEDTKALTKADVETINKDFFNNIDTKKGGKKGSPKFPMPNNWEFLLASADFMGDDKASLDAVELTLDKMASGGLYDQVGGGFARYSVDENWHIPHFEKMLYDNGQLVSLYSHAFQKFKKPDYKKIVEETLEFVARELTSPDGGFYSSLDADSEGEEGKFYVWTKEEVEEVLGVNPKTDMYCKYFSITKSGNWEDGKNHLKISEDPKKLAKENDLSDEEFAAFIAASNAKLLKKRSERVRPGLDNKILCSWNALMLTAYCDAYRAFGNEIYKEIALKSGSFLLNNMLQADNRLNRNFMDGASGINAFLDDYALTALAFISLYEISFEERWLIKAKELVQYAQAHFFDDESKMFFYTSDLDKKLVTRNKEISDNVIPSSNSSMARALSKIGYYFYDQEMLKLAEQMVKNVKPQILSGQATYFSNWGILVLDLIRPPYEIAILGPEANELRKTLSKNYLPNAILLGGQSEGSLELLKDKLQEEETLIYVCQNKVCKFPVDNAAEALGLLK